MKKMLSLLLVLAMVLSIIPCQKAEAAAESSASLTVEGLWANPGRTVDINVTIADNPGILGAVLRVSWDKSMTLVGDRSGEVFANMTYTPPSRYNPNGTNFVWFGNEVREVKDGIVLTLTFQISETAQNNDILPIEVTYTPGDVFDGNDRDVILTITNSYVHVIDYTPGDVNNDGKVNTRDLVRLSQYVSDGCVTDPEGYNAQVVEGACDVNGDGRINTRDLMRLSQYISDGNQTNPNGYNAVLLPAKLPECLHDGMTATEAKAATCTETGNDAYWYCDACQKYFGDADGMIEIDPEDAVLEALGHNVVLVPGYDPTKTEPGLTDGKACDRAGCDYVEIPQEEIPIITGYAIEYEIANGEDYIEKQELIIPADKRQYFTDEGLDLPQLKVAGYKFTGWSYSQASSDNIITQIPKGTTGDKTLYAHWAPITYTVTFDTPDVAVNGTKITGETILNATEYTVDKGKDLPVPKCFGYTFVGWSNDDGFLVTRIKPGTTGHMTLHANWTSDRNRATSYQSYGEPIIIEDDKNGQLLFVYNIGRIDNVPLNEVEFIGKTESLNFNKTVTIMDKVDETFADKINQMVSEATTKSSGWTLSQEWNDIYSTQEEVGSLSEKSDQRTTADGKVVGGKYFVSNSEGGSSHVSTESGSSSSSSSKITTENSVGINQSYDKSTEKYCDAQLGIKAHVGGSNTTELSAGVEVPVKIAKVSAGVKNTSTVEGSLDGEFGIQNGRKENEAYHADGSASSYVGTENSSTSSSYYNSSVSNSSNWNSTNGYEQSYATSHDEAVTSAIKEQISQTTTHNLSKALGGQDSTTETKEEQQMSSEEYSTSFTYAKGTQTTTTKTLEFNSSESGYYRIITAGTVHVYAVVGYDIATASYYTYCYNVLDDTTREILDYSKDNMNFNDCENGVVTFEVPYEVNEYVAGFMGKSAGLEISYNGHVTGFTADENFKGTVVVPQYDAKDNQDGSFSAVKVTSFAAEAFAGNEALETVVLPVYITEIPNGAFAGCTNLKTVIAYGVTKIGSNAFKDCTSLELFAVDTAITQLGNNAFENVPEVAIAAYDSKVADAAIGCGARRISLNISYIKDTYESKVVKIGTDVEYFALIGNGGFYQNVQIESNAAETLISNMMFDNNVTTPIKLASEKITLARVRVDNSPGFALVMTAEQVKLDLLGTIELNTGGDNAVLSKNVTLGMADKSTTSTMEVNGKYLVCGQVTNTNYLNVEPTSITEEQFNSYLVASVITFDANGGELNQTTKTVYYGQRYGELPLPTRTGYAFDGWYTAPSGGSKVTADTAVAIVANQTLYARWTANGYNVSWNTGTGCTITVQRTASPNANAATGTLSSGAVVYYGDVLSVSYAKKDYYYIASSGATSITVTGNVTASTIYATAELNPVTDWVQASTVPAGAQIVERKYTYDYTSYLTSSNSSEAGWTLINTTSAWSDYGAWSAWQDTAVSKSDSRDVQTQEVIASTQYKTVYHYYYYSTGPTDGNTSYQPTNTYGKVRSTVTFDSPLPTAGSVSGYTKYKWSNHHGTGKYMYVYADDPYTTQEVVSHTYKTQYRYRDRYLIYTYYYKQVESRTQTSMPSGDRVSNVVEWVRYRPK